MSSRLPAPKENTFHTFPVKYSVVDTGGTKINLNIIFYINYYTVNLKTDEKSI